MKVENTQTGPDMFGKRSKPAETLSYARRKHGVNDQRAQETTLARDPTPAHEGTPRYPL